MMSTQTLPDGYREILSVDLQKDKKLALLVNAAALIIAVAMVVPMCFVVPITALFDFSAGIAQYMIRFAVLFLSLIAYMVLHELIHGVTMKLCGTKKVKYGFTGLYAFAGSDDYYDKCSYITIALAPIIVWGVILVIINCLVPAQWFWVVYLIQATNVSGAAGDMYVTLKFRKFPRDILVHDCGVAMTVYAKQEDLRGVYDV